MTSTSCRSFTGTSEAPELHTKGGGLSDLPPSQVSSARPAVALRDCRDATTHATTQASSLPPSTPFFLLGNLGGRARHSTRSLSRVYSRSMMLLLGKFGAPPGMLIYNGRRAIDMVDALASTRSPSLACRLSTRQHPHRPRTCGGSSARIADAGSRGGARMQCCFRGFSAVPTPQDSGPPLHVCA